jgi:hypothetical protein
MVVWVLAQSLLLREEFTRQPCQYLATKREPHKKAQLALARKNSADPEFM